MPPILYCPHCQQYTLEHSCPTCKGQTISKKPARYSPQDPYGEYRRKLKKLQQKG